ncbi:MAG: M48 family metalloprotease [Candidatus Methylomirabilales bacterium]
MLLDRATGRYDALVSYPDGQRGHSCNIRALQVIAPKQWKTFALPLSLGLLLMWVATGCMAVIGPKMAQLNLKHRIRTEGRTAAVRSNEVMTAFHDLGLAAGLRPAKIYIAMKKAPDINAGSVGDHHFVISPALLTIDNPCLVWGIVAHELAHDILGHPKKQLRAATGVGILSGVAGVFVPGAGYLVQGAGWLGLRSYGRGQEVKADRQAVALLETAGKPPWALRYALELIGDAYGDRGGGWASTHPLTSERISGLPQVNRDHAAELCAPWDRRERYVEAQRKAIAELRRKRERQRELEEDRWFKDEEL